MHFVMGEFSTNHTLHVNSFIDFWTTPHKWIFFKTLVLPAFHQFHELSDMINPTWWVAMSGNTWIDLIIFVNTAFSTIIISMSDLLSHFWIKTGASTLHQLGLNSLKDCTATHCNCRLPHVHCRRDQIILITQDQVFFSLQESLSIICSVPLIVC